ncbi:pilS cassette protein [Neisseria meningitidis]|nr:pilS cassette protein [Neisseria meningitidis]
MQDLSETTETEFPIDSRRVRPINCLSIEFFPISFRTDKDRFPPARE